jgi:hypothetical protein
MASPIQFIGPSLAATLVGGGKQYHRDRDPDYPLVLPDLDPKLHRLSVGVLVGILQSAGGILTIYNPLRE